MKKIILKSHRFVQKSGGLLSSPRFLQLCFYSEDRKQVIQKVGHPPCFHPISPSSTLISVSDTSKRRKKRAERGQREREWERDESGSHGVIGIARGCRSVISLAGFLPGHAGPQRAIRWRSDVRHQRRHKQKLVHECFTW